MVAERLIDELRCIPMQPGSAQKVLLMLEDPDVGVDALARVIETDPALSARILGLANSPFSGTTQSVSSASRAVVVVGLAVVRALAVSTAAGLFDARTKQLPDGFWDHAVAGAAAAAAMAKHLDVPRGDAFSAGLLHDLGEVLLKRHAPERYDAIIKTSGADTSWRRLKELNAFGGDHAEIGAVALASWQLPQGFVDGIRLHHTDPSTHDNPLAKCILAGEVIAESADVGDQGHQRGVEPAWILDAVGLAGVQAQRVIQEIHAEREALGAMFADLTAR